MSAASKILIGKFAPVAARFGGLSAFLRRVIFIGQAALRQRLQLVQRLAVTTSAAIVRPSAAAVPWAA